LFDRQESVARANFWLVRAQKIQLFQQPQPGGEIADMRGMSFGPISNLTSSYLQSIFGSVLQTAGLSSSTNAASAAQTLAVQQSDGSQLSPFAQILSTLQHLQQSNPQQYQQVTQQIATNLRNAAKTAQSEGNTTAAKLNQLANDFTTASQNGQLPNVQDLAKAASAHHHHHHHFQASGADNSSSSSNSGSNTTGAASDSGLSQLLAAFQTNTSRNQALNPLSIIENTLASANNLPSNP
jgi:hypothetical protein